MSTRTVRAALLQTDWAGTKDEMIDKHEEAAREAAAAGCAGVLLPGALLRAVLLPGAGDQYYDYTEKIPDGPTTQRFQTHRQGDSAW